MKITYLIGNGFDIGLGMKTAYKDFYPYFMDLASEDNIIKQQIQKDSSDWESYEKWADLEMGLGKFTKYISPERVEKFLDDKVDLDKLLVKYLQQERARHQFEESNTVNMLVNSIRILYQWGVDEEQKLASNIYEQFKNIEVSYDVISFNYTECMHEFFMIGKQSAHTFKIPTDTGGVTHSYRLGDVFHLHGKLHDGEMILGVNDETQIENVDIRENEEIRRYMIKSELNTVIGQNKIRIARNIIDASNVICIYGMAIGDTDRMWWEYIGDWLSNSPQRLLVIFDYAPDFSPDHPRDIYKYKTKVREKFINQTKIINKDRAVLENIKKRILIKTNESVFNVSRKDVDTVNG